MINRVSAQDLSKIDSIEYILEQEMEHIAFDSASCILLDTLFESHKHNNFNKAKQICEQALQIGEHLNNYKILEHWNRNLGHLYSNYELYTIALDYYLKGQEYSKKLGFEDNWWYINIGNIYYSDRNFEKASKNYHKAIESFSENPGNDTIDAKTGIAVAYSNLGLIYVERNMYDSALIQLKTSLKIRETIYDNNSKVFICNLIADTYLSIDSSTLAKYYIKKALVFDEKTNNHAFLPNIMLIEAKIYRKQGNVDLALNKYYETVETSVKLGNKNTQIKSYLQIIESLNAKGEYNEAIKVSEKAILLTAAIENRQFRADIYKKTADLYKELKQFNKAYEYLADYIVVKDTLELFRLNKLQNSYEIEINNAELNAIAHKLEASNQRNNFYRYSIVAGFVILLIMSILLIIILRNSSALKKSVRKINKQKDTINAQYEEITQQNDLLGRHKEHLEEMIKEQTTDLIIAKEKAEHADKLKTAFLENLSHEIRTPLNAIVGFSNLMEYEEALSEDAKKFIVHINDGSNSLLRIIESIMQVSNTQVNEFKLSLTVFNLKELLGNLIAELTKTETYQSKRALKLETYIRLENPFIKSDLDVLKTIFYHLLDNAIKFTDNGTIEVGCYNTVNTDDNASILQFYVKDTGIGIEREDIKFIFDKFRKIDAEKSKLYRGIGLGLTIVKNMVEQLDGKIWVESEQNKGTTFYFTTPFVQV